MIAANSNLPLGGQTGYGPSARSFPSEEAFRNAQKRAMVDFFQGTTPSYADCGCCGAYHPVPYLGDCRCDLFRVNDPDELHGPTGWAEV